MIHLKFMGHIRTSMGSDALDLPRDDISVGELFGLLTGDGPRPGQGFTKHNTLLVVNDGEVFTASAQEGRRLRDGDSVLLVPFSHGG
jgi:molybdopterin converting factor small subunit